MIPSPQSPPVRGAVLIGGESRRMGRPKARLETGGRTLARLAAEALAPWVVDLAWVGAWESEDPEAEIAGWSDALGTPWRRLHDRPGVAGPLGALLACFDAEPDSTWIVSACDLPRLRPRTVRWLLDQFGTADLAVLPRVEGRIYPLPAVYSAGVRVALEELAESAYRSLQPLAGVRGVRVVEVPAALSLDFANVNSTTDWAPFA